MLILLIVAVIGFVYGFFYYLKQYRIFSDTPESKIRSAPQGYNILCGKPSRLNMELLESPLTKTPCCWYSYQISIDKTTRDGGKERETIQEGKSRKAICIEDDTGICVLEDTYHAEIEPAISNSWNERSKKPIDTGHEHSKIAKAIHSFLTEPLIGNRKYYYLEQIITPDDRLHVAGFFKTSEKSEVTESIGYEDYVTFCHHLSDLGKDIHTIGKKPKDSRPYVITTLSLKKTQRKILWNALVFLGLAAIFGCVTIYVVMQKFGIQQP